jgi:beta-lactamase regulating signal transducer with metallopeptidase domain
MNAWTLAWVAVVLDSLAALTVVWLIVRLAFCTPLGTAQRYRLAFGSMLLVLMLAVVDFFLNLNALRRVATLDRSELQALALSDVESWPALAWNFWLAGALALFAWRVLGMIGIATILRNSQPARPWLETMASECGHELGLRRAPKILESKQISTPMLIGWFAPKVLWPSAHLDGVDRNEIRLLLLHELVHLRRGDPIALLVQLFIEGLFFYHPAIWALSHLSSHEREASCDEIVVQHSRQADIYAQALIHLEEVRPFTSNPLATAARSSKNPMIDRLSRIVRSRVLSPPARGRRFDPWPASLICAAGLAVLALGHFALAQPTRSCDQGVCTGVAETDRRLSAIWPTIRAASQRYGVDAKLLVALCITESNGFVDAKSPMGAVGLMQVMPSTFAKLAAERNLPAPTPAQQFEVETNVDYAAYLMRSNLDRYAAEHDEEHARRLAIAAYNAGEKKVAEVLAGRSIFNPETIRHGENVRHWLDVVNFGDAGDSE